MSAVSRNFNRLAVAVVIALAFIFAAPQSAGAATVYFSAARYSPSSINDVCMVHGFLSYNDTPEAGGTVTFDTMLAFNWVYAPGGCPINPGSIYMDYAGSTGSPLYDSLGTWGHGRFSAASPNILDETTDGHDVLPAPATAGRHTLNARLNFEESPRYAGQWGSGGDATQATLEFNVPAPSTPPLLNLFWK